VLEEDDMISVINAMLEISNTKDIEVSMEKNIRNKIEIKQRIDLCEAGCSVVSVAADGNVYPCAGLHEDEFCAGNIREQPLENIWRESEVLTQFKSFSVLNIPECKDCKLKFICGGGCHVDRYYAYERLDAPTPECNVQQKLYWNLLSEKVRKARSGL
jgi:radical SAM protein with 4Fe4S-binding SPASM domain